MTRDATRQIEILLPTAPHGEEATSRTWLLDRALDGVVVGLRSDHSWRSYFVVLEVWEHLLRADGADVRVLWTGDRVGPQGEQTRADVDEWSRLVECGVVGLGN
jgi:hypothetical protein